MTTVQSAVDALISVRDEVAGGENARNQRVAVKEQEVDRFIASARDQLPALNLFTDPLYKNASSLFGAHNPNGFTFTSEQVAWNYNATTVEMARQTLNLDGDNLRCCGLISETGAKMLKVNITKPAGADAFILSYLNPRRAGIHSGVFTHIIAAIGVTKGRFRMGEDDYVEAGQVVTDYGRQVYSDLWGWHHLDVVFTYIDTDEVEFFVFMPVLATGVIDKARFVTTMDGGV